MITLLHGDDAEQSRKEFARLKHESHGKELRDLSESILSENALRQGLESRSLFGSDTYIVFENAISSFGRKEKALNGFLAIIKENSGSDMLFWEGKEVGKSVLSKLGGAAKIQLFKLPVVLFSFLDSIAPNNVSAMVDLYRKTVAQNDAYLVFTMIARRIHDLVCILESVPVDARQAWQVGRLTKQAKLFTIDKLLSMQRSLLSLDIVNKSGLSALPLQASVELFLATL